MHHRADELAVVALRKREADFVKAHAWKTREVFADILGDTSCIPENPETIDELIHPLVLLTERLDSSPEPTAHDDELTPRSDLR